MIEKWTIQPNEKGSRILWAMFHFHETSEILERETHARFLKSLQESPKRIQCPVNEDPFAQAHELGHFAHAFWALGNWPTHK